MDLWNLIRQLSDPAAYPCPVEQVEVRQTHISVVFLAGPYTYKVKKPLNLGFLDYSTLEKRRLNCERELTLNRRLAAPVYLGVVPISCLDSGAGADTRVRMEGDGEVVEWAVKMQRLPDEASLRRQLACSGAGEAEIRRLARRIAAFHHAAETGPEISSCGKFDVVARNARENFTESETQIGTAVGRAVFQRLQELTEVALAGHREQINDRAFRNVPRDTHGDLRLDHVYLFPDREPPADFAIVDCIEFNERFRYADPVADIAFLVMELIRIGRRELADALAESYFLATGDASGRALLSFYVTYRAVVRAKVEGLKASEPEIPPADRASALSESRAQWLVALGEAECPAQRPCVVLVGGLPGTGKSTLAEDLEQTAGFIVVRSDLVRKNLAGLEPDQSAPSSYGHGIYTDESKECVYLECARQVEALLFEGKRLVVDASFGREHHRRMFLELASRWGVPVVFFVCAVPAEVVRSRLKSRRQGPSDADWTIYLGAAGHWEEPGLVSKKSMTEIVTDGDRAAGTLRALSVLRELGLVEPK